MTAQVDGKDRMSRLGELPGKILKDPAMLRDTVHADEPPRPGRSPATGLQNHLNTPRLRIYIRIAPAPP
jgi:hypothetical protein